MNPENRVKSEFENINPEINAEAIVKKARTASTQKSRRTPKRAFVLAFAAIILTIGGAVFADEIGSLFLSRGMTELAEIVGDTRIADITPIVFFDNYGNFSEEITTPCGLIINLAAFAVTGSFVDIYVMLNDPYLNRLKGDIHLNYRLMPSHDRHWDLAPLDMAWSLEPFETIDRNEDSGTVTLHSRIRFSVPVENFNLQFSIYNIYFNLTEHRYVPILSTLAYVDQSPATIPIAPLAGELQFFGDTYYEKRAIKRAISGFVNDGNLLYLDSEFGSHFITVFERRWAWVDEVAASMSPTLAPVKNEILVEGSRHTLVATGIIDGRLSVQTKGPHIPYRTLITNYDRTWFGWRNMYPIMLFLQTNENKTIGSISRHYFLNEDKSAKAAWVWQLHSLLAPKPESVFTEHVFRLNTENLDNYALYGHFFTMDVIDIDFSTTLNVVYKNNQNRIITGLDEFWCEISRISEITITPASILFNLEYTKDSDSTFAWTALRRNQIILHMANGEDITAPHRLHLFANIFELSENKTINPHDVTAISIFPGARIELP
ncbi:MAG: hypothetical protein FWB74_05875 [Defluviitaleaceae bacterium]|nr:hypothetical protein [Defluviitaleaceae bacterium]